MSLLLREFDGADALDVALSERLIDGLAAAIDARGEAILAVSGGRTPAGLFKCLSDAPLDFSKVMITLTDERCVPIDHPDSNAQMVQRLLLQGKAKQARFIPLYDAALDLAAQRQTLNVQFNGLPTFDAVVLGMGLDGHTASLFPGATGLSAAMDLSSDRAVTMMQPLTAPHARMSLTAARLLKTRALILHVTGEEKLSLLNTVSGGVDVMQYPVGLFLTQNAPATEVFWAP
jgi:6-phosphogluconolactonase